MRGERRRGGKERKGGWRGKGGGDADVAQKNGDKLRVGVIGGGERIGWDRIERKRFMNLLV